MGYVIINSSGKRIRRNGILTPVFEYPIQAQKYINKKLGGSPSSKIIKI